MLRIGILPVLGLIAVFGFACGDSGGDLPSTVTTAASVQQVVTTTPTASAAATATPGPTLLPSLAPLPTLPPIPEDWLTNVDAVLGFSLRYPPDLVLTDTGPSPLGGLRERDLVFRSAQDQSRVFSISIVESNPAGLTIDEWAVEFAACNPKSIEEGSLAGIRAIFCSREVVEGHPEPSVLAEHDGRIFLISTGSALTDSEFTAVLQSFQF